MENNQTSKTDVLGLISIIMAFMGLALPGLILGIVGLKKAKRENQPTILSVIGLIINAIVMMLFVLGMIMVIVFSATPALQRNSRDVQRKNDVSLIASELQLFYSNNRYYPSDLSELEGAVKTVDPQNKPYSYTPQPEGCLQCTSYEIESNLENGETYQLSSD